jgi:hypothetical protein
MLQLPGWLHRAAWIKTYQRNLPLVDIGQVIQLWQEVSRRELQPDAENSESNWV